MNATSVSIQFDSQFGAAGTGNGQFNYPAGSVVVNDNLYVVDKQNHRVQYFDLDGNFVGQFGSEGSGDDNFYFPEDICSDGTTLYITDSANHRIKRHDLTGTYIGEFGGSVGSNIGQFNYPIGIDTDGTYLYIVDRQNNRVKKHTLLGSFIVSITGFNFPEGIALFDNSLLAICDSGNDRVAVYSADGTFNFEITNTNFEYIVAVADANNVLVVVDRQRNSFFNYNYSGELLSEFDNNFEFPLGVAYHNNEIFLSDSFNQRIQIYSFLVSTESLQYFQPLLNLTRQLYPTGRSFWLPVQSFFHKLHEGLALSENRTMVEAFGLLDRILPDNDNFSTKDATNWETALGLPISPSGVSLEDRKTIIERKIQFPGTIKARQTAKYLEDELQKVGFDVYVHENRTPDGSGGYEIINTIPAVYGEFNYGQQTYGVAGIDEYTKIANYIDETKDESFNFGQEVNLRATFYIGAESFGDRANVPANRKREFRELILKIKPAQTAGFLLIDYV